MSVYYPKGFENSDKIERLFNDFHERTGEDFGETGYFYTTVAGYDTGGLLAIEIFFSGVMFGMPDEDHTIWVITSDSLNYDVDNVRCAYLFADSKNEDEAAAAVKKLMDEWERENAEEEKK